MTTFNYFTDIVTMLKRQQINLLLQFQRQMRIISTVIPFNSEFRGVRDKHQIIEEPCEINVSCTVLQPSQRGDFLAQASIQAMALTLAIASARLYMQRPAILIAQTCNQDIFQPGLNATIISVEPGLIATETGLFATSLQSSVSTRINCK